MIAWWWTQKMRLKEMTCAPSKGVPFNMAENAGNIGGRRVCNPHCTIIKWIHFFQCSNIKESCYKKLSYTFRPQICYGNSTWNVKLFSTHVQNDRKSNQKSQYQFTCKWKATKEIIDIELIVWSLGLLTSCALAQNFICIINIRGVISCIWEVSCHLASQSKPR